MDVEKMCPQHPNWNAFYQRLGMLVTEHGCDNAIERPQGKAALAEMGFDDPGIEASLRYFDGEGVYCDCEILMNVGAIGCEKAQEADEQDQKQQVKMNPILTRLSDVKPDPRKVMQFESAYRRGVSQALSRACDMIRAGATGDDLALMTDLSMEMRYDGEQHPTYLDELSKRFRAKRKAGG
ncbi:MAG: hypothetical protein ACYTEK_06530 [Planctomycetota bacterium]|jgi:hypothetical protein